MADFSPSDLVKKTKKIPSSDENRPASNEGSSMPTHPHNNPDNGGHSAAHPGFKAVQGKIARERGVSEDRAGAILGAASRGASPAAKAKNPRLKRVKG